MKSSLENVLDKRTLREMAGPKSFERGKDYFGNGAVQSILEHKGILSGQVEGSRLYQVKLWMDSGEVKFSCTCPFAEDGNFCKHAVALGLARLEGGIEAIKRGTMNAMEKIESYLQNQGKDSLIQLLMEQAVEDEPLRKRLLLRSATQKNGKGLDTSAFKKAIDRAFQTSGFIGYREMHDYSQGIQEVLLSIETLLDQGHAETVIELTEHAVRTWEEAIESVDDSDGYMGDILGQLQQMHHSACLKAKPDPVLLAKRLFAWEMQSDWDILDHTAGVLYADVLEKEGLEVYRKLAEAEWKSVRPLGPGEEKETYEGKRFRITRIMEELATQSKDTESLVNVLKRDLSHVYNYIQIAQIYKKDGLADRALEWAENGLKAFPKETDPRLLDFLVREYFQRKRYDEAMSLVWAEFTGHPYLDHYQKLKAWADRLPSPARGQPPHWFSWRGKALTHIREELAKDRKGPFKTDHSTLVQIHLWENDPESAWQEAKGGGCSEDLWMRLAQKREKDHPQDAIKVYRDWVEPVVRQGDNSAYEHATDLIKKIKRLMKRMGNEGEFTRYLDSLRATYKIKRNFIKMIAGLS